MFPSGNHRGAVGGEQLLWSSKQQVIQTFLHKLQLRLTIHHKDIIVSFWMETMCIVFYFNSSNHFVTVVCLDFVNSGSVYCQSSNSHSPADIISCHKFKSCLTWLSARLDETECCEQSGSGNDDRSHFVLISGLQSEEVKKWLLPVFKLRCHRRSLKHITTCDYSVTTFTNIL